MDSTSRKKSQISTFLFDKWRQSIRYYNSKITLVGRTPHRKNKVRKEKEEKNRSPVINSPSIYKVLFKIYSASCVMACTVPSLKQLGKYKSYNSHFAYLVEMYTHFSYTKSDARICHASFLLVYYA